MRNFARQMQRFDLCIVTVLLSSGKTRDPRLNAFIADFQVQIKSKIVLVSGRLIRPSAKLLGTE